MNTTSLTMEHDMDILLKKVSLLKTNLKNGTIDKTSFISKTKLVWDEIKGLLSDSLNLVDNTTTFYKLWPCSK